jgi:hypothetical protein
MMQISEYFIWKGQDKGQDNLQLTLGTKASLVFNITQPLVVFLCLIMISKVKMSFKIVASVVILFYISFMLLNLNRQKEYIALSPTPKCEHMSLQWWNDIKNSGIVYIVVLMTIFLLLLRPYNLSLFITSSYVFYSCGNASMWCWLVGIFYKQCLEK